MQQDFPEAWGYAVGSTGSLPVIPGQTFTGRERILRPVPTPVFPLGSLEQHPMPDDPKEAAVKILMIMGVFAVLGVT